MPASVREDEGGWALPPLLRFSDLVVTALADQREEIDALNVYPVPDGDTGTNLLLTAESAADAVAVADGSESSWSVFARGAVLGARGNSGAILAQLLRGLADTLAGAGPVDGALFATALRGAAGSAYEAVAAVLLGGDRHRSPLTRPMRIEALDRLVAGPAEEAERERISHLVAAVTGAPQPAGVAPPRWEPLVGA